jgi:hypothetical protein
MNEENIGLNSTRNKAIFPRGKWHNRTESKTTVSLYLERNLVERARNHKLNLSRITEQALSSILDYLETQNTESSQVLGEASFQEGFGEGRGRDLNPGARLHRPIGYQATSPRPLFGGLRSLAMLALISVF